jgi:hypothetical protein
MFAGICPIQWIGRYSLKKSDPTKRTGQKGAAGSGRSIGGWSRCSVCRSVCHEGTRIAHQWRPGNSR